MSSPVRSESLAGDSSPNGQAPEERPRLTEKEKKQNHIASEHKRRQAIREGFDRLCDIVPGMEGQGRSEGIVLRETTRYMQQLLEERRAMIQEIEARGGQVDEEMKDPIIHNTDAKGNFKWEGMEPKPE